MPFHFDIEPDLDLLYILAEGRVTGGQFARSVEALLLEDTSVFRPDIDTLFDISADTQVDLEDNEVIDELAEAVRAARQGQPYRMACVVRSQEHETFFQAALAILNPEAEVCAFYGRPAALGWLGHARMKAQRLKKMRARMISRRRTDEAAADRRVAGRNEPWATPADHASTRVSERTRS